MDYLKKIDTVIQKLNKAGYIAESKRIALLETHASVGSELLTGVTHELLILIGMNDEINELIGVETFDLKDFCWSIGLLVR
jgi:hypothetical protein